MRRAAQSLRAPGAFARLCVLPLALAAVTAGALEIEYATEARPEPLRECDVDRHRGEWLAARDCYERVLREHDDPRIAARAALALDDLQDANDRFRAAVEQYPEDPDVRAAWGELFLRTHQNDEAVRLFQEALELDDAHAAAKIGLAELSAQRFEGQARELLGQVIDTDPDRVEAQLLLARMDLEEGNVDDGDARLDTALEIVERTGDPPLEIYALKAAVDLLRGVEAGDWTERALEYNAAYGEIYATPAHFYVITRRYREAIELLERAVRVEPDLYSAHAELGVNLLRENRVAEAQEHLALAYRGDPYSAQIVNTLRLIDSFDNFVVSRHGRAADPESSRPGVILKLHADEAEVIRPYVLDLVYDSIAAYTQRYEFELAEPVVVELYPEHDDFAVRTAGLPGIGLLGVAFGYVVAMDSPAARSAGEFHWGTTLWHEMAHIFTLETTNHLVPRWFSEGISVFEEWQTGPLPGRHIPPNVLQAIADDKLLPVAELDSGFIRPSYDNQIVVSYMQAGLICEFIASTWRQAALVEMLGVFRDGGDTVAALEQALGISAGEFDTRFAAHVEAELGGVLDALDEWQSAQRRAHELAGGGDWTGARDAAHRAIELYPEYVDEGSAYLVAAEAAEQLGEDESATDLLTTYHELGGYHPDALARLASHLDAAGRRAAALGVLEDVRWVAPLTASLHSRLGDWLLEAGRAEQALTEYTLWQATEPHDQANVHFKLARAYLALDDREKGREHLLYALEIAPQFREAQQLLLEIVR